MLELGQLGVVEQQTDSATEYGLRAKWRLESLKAFVSHDCSARFARPCLRQSGPIDMLETSSCVGPNNRSDWL